MIESIAQQVTGKWWTFLVRALVVLALAVYIFMEPSVAQTGLVYIVGAYFILNGIVTLAGGISLTGFGPWPALVLSGLVQLALGIVMVAQPGIGPLALAYLVAIWAISTGLMEISAAIALRDSISNEGWWIVLGILTIALGAYIVIRPDLGVTALVYAVGIYALLAAGALLAVAFRLRSAGGKLQQLTNSKAAST